MCLILVWENILTCIFPNCPSCSFVCLILFFLVLEKANVDSRRELLIEDITLTKININEDPTYLQR